MARPKNTNQRRREITQGLLRAMAERGYEGASIQDIAQAAGLSSGLVHYHFDSKQQILIALIDLLGERVLERYEERAKGASSPRARLYAFLDAYVARGAGSSSEAVACWVAIGAEALRQPQVQVAYGRAVRAGLERLEALVRAVLEDERRSTDSVAEIAAGIMSAIHGMYQLAVVAHAAPKDFAAGSLRRMADGLINAQREVRS